MSSAQDVARRYFEAWTTGDRAAVTDLLAPDFRFTAGELSIAGRDAFLAGASFPADARTTMVAEAYQGNVGFQMYDASRAGRTVRIVEQLTMRDGAIASAEVVTDPSAFAAFAGAPATS